MAKCRHRNVKHLRPVKKDQERFRCENCGVIWVVKLAKLREKKQT